MDVLPNGLDMATFHQVRRQVGSQQALSRRNKTLVAALGIAIALAVGLIYLLTA